MTSSRYVAFLFSLLLLPSQQAQAFYCPFGEPVSASLGDGVIMYTCMWQKEPDLAVRAGPLQLWRNGVLILELRTNSNGKLHGRYSAWSDTGELTDQGKYDDGLKQGAWLETDAEGRQNTLHYRDGVAINR